MRRPTTPSKPATPRRPVKPAEGAAPNAPHDLRSDLYVGRNLRHARLAAGFTLKELAELVGCSESLLSKVENQKVLPSLHMLHRVVSHLGTSIGNFFTDSSAEPGIVMRRGTRRTISTGHPRRKGNNAGVTLEWLVPYPGAKLLSGSIHMIAVGGGSRGAIVHKGEEMGYVLKGTFELEVCAKKHLLEPGDSFFFPSEMPHGYRNPGNTETWVLWVNTPPTF